MNEKPISHDEIFNQLNKFQAMDCKYSDGRILGSMCTEAHPIAKEAFFKFIDSNLGDPGLFKGTKLLEDKVLKMIGSFLSIENPVGHMVTGGTEANIMAIRSARNLARDNKGIKKGELIVPKSAHFSFKKAADMLDLKLIRVDLDENYRINPKCVEENINENTIAIVGIAGTTELGMIDPIEDLSKMAIQNDIHLHVDAAFGGFSIPFLKDKGYDLPNFDFSLEGVKSITVDPHKMGLSPIPSGGILLAATYAVMSYLGKEGYANNAIEAMEKTHFLADNLKNLGYELIVEPKLNIVAFNHPYLETFELAQLLEERNWKISCSSYPKAIRVILMNHIKKEHLVELISDLDEINKSL